MTGELRWYNPLSEISMLLPFYVVYIFLSGWAFDDYYFRSFGLDPKFLDRNFHDTLVKGFTIIFAGSGVWIPYALLLLPLLVKNFPRRPFLRLLSTVALALMLLVTVYLLSRSAGERTARTDKGDKSTLPDITFAIGKQQLVGKLLYIRGDSYFIHRVRRQAEESGGELQLSVYRSSQMDEVKVTEHD